MAATLVATVVVTKRLPTTKQKRHAEHHPEDDDGEEEDDDDRFTAPPPRRVNHDPPQQPLPQELYTMMDVGKASVPRQGAIQVVEALHHCVQTDGKHKGNTFSHIYANDIQYVQWLRSHKSGTSNTGTMALVIYAEFRARL